jgi:undecaprenyl-diphosphatase
MDPIQGFALGVVQGLTEPLPISSSGHLILVPWLIGWSDHSLTFDVALHMGTLAALLVVFWRDWMTLLAAWLPGPLHAGLTAVRVTDDSPLEDVPSGAGSRSLDQRLGIGLILGTVPAAAIGVLFQDEIESALRSPALIAIVMLVASVVIFAADRMSLRQLGLEVVTVGRALTIGVAQALALAPGVSRSGITIATGLALGLTREAAARYAFLLATPVTAGAGIVKLGHLIKDGVPADERVAFFIGIIASFVVGLVAIRFLLRYLQRYSLDVFIAYRVVVAVVVLGLSYIRAHAT